MRFVDVCMMVIVEYMTASNSLAANSKAIYMCYNRVWKMMVNLEGILSLPKHLGREVPAVKPLRSDVQAAKPLRITHLDYSTLPISSERDILLLVQATDALVEKNY